MKKEQNNSTSDVLTVGEIIDELKKLPKQAEVRFTDVCGNWEFELYQIEIDAERGMVLLVGDNTYD